MILSVFADLARRRAGFLIKAQEGSARLFHHYPIIRRDFKTGLQKPEAPRRLGPYAYGDADNPRWQRNGGHRVLGRRYRLTGVSFRNYIQ